MTLKKPFVLVIESKEKDDPGSEGGFVKHMLNLCGYPAEKEVFCAAFFKKLRRRLPGNLTAPTVRPVQEPGPWTNTPPPGIAGQGLLRLLLPAGFAAAGPDEGVTIAAFIVEEVGVDRGAEARVIQLDRDIIAPLGGTFGPPCPDFGIMRCTA